MPDISLVGVGALGATTASDLAPAFPSGLAQDDVLLAKLYSSAGNTPSPPTGQGWTQVDTIVASGVSSRGTLFRKVFNSGDTSQAFTGGGTTGFYGVISGWRDVDTSTPLDVSVATSTGTGGDPVASSVTTVTDGAMVVALFSGDDNNTITTPVTNSATLTYGGTSYSATTGNDACFAAAHKLQVTAGAVGTISADQTTGQARENWTAFTVALRPAATPVEVNDTTSAGLLAASPTGESVEALTGDVAVDDTQPAGVGTASPAGESVASEVDDEASAGTLSAAPDGAMVGVAADDSVPAALLLVAPVGETVRVESPGLPVDGDPNVFWWAIHPDTGARVALPHVGPWELSPIAHESGSIRVDYPAHGLNFDVLDDFVTNERDLEIEVWLSGQQAGALRGYLTDKAYDGVAEERVARFGGHFLEWRMTKIVVAPVDAHPKKETVFSAATAGGVLGTLMSRAHARGTATDITTATFTASVDSNGAPWSKTVSATYSPVQTTYAQILAELVELGVCEWEITPAHELKLYEPGTRGTDRTLGPDPVVLHRGRNLTDVPVRVSSRDGGTDVWAVGKDGLYHHEFSATARTARGRQDEVGFSANSIGDAGALDAATEARLPVVTAGRREVTHGLVLGTGPSNRSGLGIGDWVYSNTGATDTAGGGNERLRLRQWSLSRDGGGDYSGTVTLNDVISEALVELHQQLARLRSGATVVGTSTPPDTLAPAAPLGITVASSAYQEGVDTYAALTVGWSQVTTNSDGSTATDVAGYRVQWRHDTDPAGVWNLGADASGAGTVSASFGGVGAGVNVTVRVAAYDQNGNTSAWSAEVAHLTASDATAPPTPSTPTVVPYLGQLRIGWDGLGSVGEAMPVDLERVEVHLSTSAAFTPSAATLIDHFGTIAGFRIATDLTYGTTYYVRLVAVDRSGNASAPSATASAVPEQVVSADVFDGAIGSAKLADLAVITAKIADLAVNDAKIGDLSVGKLTAGTMTADVTNSGIIRSGTTGQRYELDAASFRLYNSSGTQTVGLTGSSGTNFITGEIRSALTGERFVINPGGTMPSELRFYPSSGSQYGTINTVTSNSVTFGDQSGLSIKAHSGRADNFSGQVQMFPDYASMSWGETSIQTVPHQIGMGAPRYHFAVDRNSEFSDDGVMRFGTKSSTVPSSFQDNTVIEYRLSAADEPQWRVPSRNSGLGFGPSFTGSVNGDSSGYVAHRASSFDVFTSTRDTKTEIADLDYTGGPLAVLRRAKVQRWKRLSELPTRPDDPPAPIHIGPMVDDLPAELVRTDSTLGLSGLSLPSLVGLVHAGVDQLAGQLDALTARVAALETRTAGGAR